LGCSRTYWCAGERLKLDAEPANLSQWEAVVDAQLNPEREVRIAIVGKYLDLLDAYKSLVEAIVHAGIHTRTKVRIDYIDAQTLMNEGTAGLADVSAILVPGGFGERGFEGKIRAVQYARENKLPYLGICYGLHAALVEFARNVAGIADANTTEVETATQNPVIGLVTEWTEAPCVSAHRPVCWRLLRWPPNSMALNPWTSATGIATR